MNPGKKLNRLMIILSLSIKSWSFLMRMRWRLICRTLMFQIGNLGAVRVNVLPLGTGMGFGFFDFFSGPLLVQIFS